MFYSLLLAILLPTAVFSLKCLPSNFAAEYPIKNFNMLEFQSSVSTARPSNRFDYCETQLVIKHLEQVIQIRSIKNPIETDPESKAVLWFGNKITRNTNPDYYLPVSIERHFTVRCETDDFCDSAMILRYLPKFLAENYQRTVDLALPLFSEQSGHSDSCGLFHTDSIPCNTGFCYIHSSMSNPNMSVECADNSNQDIRFEYKWDASYVGGPQYIDSQNNVVTMYYMLRQPVDHFTYACQSDFCKTMTVLTAFKALESDVYFKSMVGLLTFVADAITIKKPAGFAPLNLREALVNQMPKSSKTMGSSINTASFEHMEKLEIKEGVSDEMKQKKD